MTFKFPQTDDPLVTALQRLIQRTGSYVAVADKIDVNDQSLYQIAMMKRHSATGRVKSVGPTIRKKLDQAFPGWLSASATVQEPETPWPAMPNGNAWPHQRLPASYWAGLNLAERAIVEEAMLDTYDRLMARREQLRSERSAPRKALKPAA